MRRLSQAVALIVALGATGLVPALAHAVTGESDDCGADRDGPMPAGDARESRQEDRPEDDEEPCRDCGADACGICLFCPARVVPAVIAVTGPVRAFSSLDRIVPTSPVGFADGDDIFHPPRS